MYAYVYGCIFGWMYACMHTYNILDTKAEKMYRIFYLLLMHPMLLIISSHFYISRIPNIFCKSLFDMKKDILIIRSIITSSGVTEM